MCKSDGYNRRNRCRFSTADSSSNAVLVDHLVRQDVIYIVPLNIDITEPLIKDKLKVSERLISATRVYNNSKSSIDRIFLKTSKPYSLFLSDVLKLNITDFPTILQIRNETDNTINYNYIFLKNKAVLENEIL